ncbi:zinc finger protein 436-like isoform X3 [Hyla sarda]|uniref:zinc finger protein 436-like isoform X3 n=1 Tax=Hyla sarda TaxID=327740 RepID=UPI0024C3C482|nr:zinc finger protein 436-like isoform X3 [Hyla sarda]
MEKDLDVMEERILHVALEIMSLLSGEDYMVVKTEEGEGWSREQVPISLPPPHSLIHKGNSHQEILELINKMADLLTGEVPIRCQDVTVYFSMEEWEYIEGHKDLYQDIVMMGDHRPPTSPLDIDPTRMEKARKHMAARILHLTLEIIHLITGEDYTVVKKWSGECVTPRVSGGSGTTQSPTPEDPPPHSLIHEQKILELTTRMTELLTGEVPIRCQDVTVYFSMEEWEYIEGHKDLYQDIVMMGDHRTPTSQDIDPTRMEKARKHMAARILHLTLEIIHLITGEDYTVVKKWSGECVTPRVSGGSGTTQSPTPEDPPHHSLIHEQKILELTTRMTELLTGEVPIRCQDVTVYFSMEEWEYIEGHKDLYQDIVMMGDHRPPTSQENLNKDIDGNFVSLNLKVQEEEVLQHSPGKDLLPLTVHPGPYSTDLSYNAPNHGEPSPDPSQVVTTRTDQREGKKFHCGECKKEFTKNSDLISHRKSHTEYSCSLCGKCFTDTSELLAHERMHIGDQLYICSKCGERFSQKKDILKHEKTHSVARSYPCPECGKCFTHKPSLAMHKKSHEKKISPSCLECGKSFKNKWYLRIHYRIHTGENPHSCSECGKCFTTKAGLVRHERIHTGEKPFKCSECGKCFIDLSHLGKHKPIHTGDKPYSCSECERCFSHKSDLVQHQRIHTGEKPYSCSQCAKNFTTKTNLVVHEKSHTGEKPFSCSECGKYFAHKSRLVIHMRNHTGEKPYSCSECGKCFKSKTILDVHERNHTGEKPYSCSECGKGFPTKGNLARHQRKHTGEKPYSCSECEKRFGHKADLFRHLKLHRGGKTT